jgi:hypothetical protein
MLVAISGHKSAQEGRRIFGRAAGKPRGRRKA